MRKGSNLRPLVLETRALPTELLMYGGKRRTRPPVKFITRHPVFKTGRGSNATASLSMLWDLVDSNHSPVETRFTVWLPYPNDFQFPCCGATWYRTRISGFSVPRIDRLCYSSKKKKPGYYSGPCSIMLNLNTRHYFNSYPDHP